MYCTECGAENLGGGRLCQQCGAALVSKEGNVENKQDLAKIPEGVVLGCVASIIASLLLCIFSSYVIPRILGVEKSDFIGGPQENLRMAANCYVPIALAVWGGLAVWFLVYNWYVRQVKG